MFADDCTVSCAIPRTNVNYAHTNINENLDKIYKWLCANRIQINTGKTKYMIYSYRDSYRIASPIVIGGDEISVTDNTRFLGVTLDNNLKFELHVNQISSKLSRSIGVLGKINSFVPSNILTSLYYTLVHPYLCYALEAWYHAPSYVTNRVDVLQKRAVRCVNKLPFHEHTGEYFRRMNLLRLNDLFKYSMAVYIFKTININEYDPRLSGVLRSFQGIHDHTTRHNYNYILPIYNRVTSQAAVEFSSVKIWNNIPIIIRSVTNLISFKKHFKTFICNNY